MFFASNKQIEAKAQRQPHRACHVLKPEISFTLPLMFGYPFVEFPGLVTSATSWWFHADVWGLMFFPARLGK